MTEETDPIVPEAHLSTSTGPKSADHVLEDLRSIMQLAGEQYHGEQRLDVSNEVADTVRFAQASMLWRERVTPQVELQFHLNHEHLPMVTGQVLWISTQFACLADERHEYLVNLAHVVMVSGLPSVGAAIRPSAVTEQMDGIWLGGLLEDQQLASWYLGSHQVVVGRCIRLGLDAVDARMNGLGITLMREHLTAVRIQLQD